MSRLDLGGDKEEDAQLRDDEFSELRRYLDVQFERQARLFENLEHEVKLQRMYQGHGGGDVPRSPRMGHAVSDGFFGQHSQEIERMTSPDDQNADPYAGGAKSDFVERIISRRKLKASRTASKARTGSLRSSEPESYKGRLKCIVNSPYFTYVIMALILVNGILLGVEIDVAATLGQADIPGWYAVVNALMVFIFFMEIVIKLYALGCETFWRGSESSWNIFDFVIVVISLAETAVDLWAKAAATDGSSSIRLVRALRLARTLRSVRVIRLFRFFSPLRGLLLSIMSTMGSLLWTLLLLQILFYMFAVIFSQMVTDYCRFLEVERTGDSNAVPVCPGKLNEYWSNVMDSMHTLFLSITGGIDWYDAYEPLRDVSALAIALMNLYIVIGFFTILNVVTGTFVNTAIESAAADKDLAAQKQSQRRKSQMSSLRHIFSDITIDMDEQVTIENLQEAMTKNNNQLSSFLQSMGISTDDLWTLFLLIDEDDNGVVDIDEFVSGCMQLRGPAQSLQVAKMGYENKLTREAIKQIAKDVRVVKQSMVNPTVVREAC